MADGGTALHGALRQLSDQAWHWRQNSGRLEQCRPDNGALQVPEAFPCRCDFRRLEHARGIADPAEGSKLIIADIERAHFATPDDAKAFNELGPVKIAANDITIAGISFHVPKRSADCFLLCLSSELSARVQAEFDGMDSCIAVVDPVAFLKELTATLNSVCRVRFQGLHECRYMKRTEKWNGKDLGTHPALIKEPEFREQKEVRAIWTPLQRDHPIAPLIIGSAELGMFCKDVSSELLAEALTA